MANGYTPPNLGNIIEDPAKRKATYKTVGIVGLLLTAATAGLAAFGVTPETFPWLLAAWSVFGVFSSASNGLANSNTP